MSPALFSIYRLKAGDEVQLRYTGDSGVPLRLGEAWGRVSRIPWYGQWRKVPPRRIPVETYTEVGVERRVLLDQVHTVQRGGKTIAERRQTHAGTALFEVESA